MTVTCGGGHLTVWFSFDVDASCFLGKKNHHTTMSYTPSCQAGNWNGSYELLGKTVFLLEGTVAPKIKLPLTPCAIYSSRLFGFELACFGEFSSRDVCLLLNIKELNGTWLVVLKAPKSCIQKTIAKRPLPVFMTWLPIIYKFGVSSFMEKHVFLFTEKHCISVQKKVFLIMDKVVHACDNVA